MNFGEAVLASPFFCFGQRHILFKNERKCVWMSSAWYRPTPAHQETHRTLPTPVVLQEAVPLPQSSPGPKVCIPGKTQVIDPIPEKNPAQDQPMIRLNVSGKKPQKDSLSRYLSLQTCAALATLALVFLLRTVSPSAFLGVQAVMKDAVSDLSSVAQVSLWISQAQEQGLRETLRLALMQGMEEPQASGSVSAMGGVHNPVAAQKTTEFPETAAAAGGRYPVSAEDWKAEVFQTGIVCPVDGVLTSEYGPREHPITGKADFHTGIDLAAAAGTPILAAASGIVEQCGEDKSLGRFLVLRHSKDTVTTYSHCQRLLVREGEAVDRGEQIALVGSTGSSTGPHLHFECIVDGALIDPQELLGEA